MSGVNTVLYLIGISVALYMSLVFYPRDLQIPRPVNFVGEYVDIVGIEFGSQYLRLGLTENKQFRFLVNDHGAVNTASCVSFTGSKVLVGSKALQAANWNPKNTICDIRNLLGRNFSDAEFREQVDSAAYNMIERPKDKKPIIQLEINGSTKLITLEEIAAKLLENLKLNAEQYLGHELRGAIVTLPAYFSEKQREALRSAGRIAGLDIIRIINEPVAAGIAYEIEKHCFGQHREEFVLVYKLGVNSFDVTLESIECGVFEVISMARDLNIGGKDFDDAVLKYLIDEFRVKNGANAVEDDSDLEDLLRDQTTRLVETLTTKESAKIWIPAHGSETKGFTEVITRGQLEMLHRILFQNTLLKLEESLKEAKLSKEQVDKIILIGDPKHITIIQPFLEEDFDKMKFLQGVPSDEVIVRGAANQARYMSSGEGVSSCPPLPDVNPLSLGVETRNGVFVRLIPRNNVVPTRKVRVFTTVKDNQSRIVLNIVEGDRAMVKDNDIIGTLQLRGIAPAPKGVPRIEIIFGHDADWVLTVMAREVGNLAGREPRISIPMDTGHHGDQEVIDAVLQEADKYYEEDRLSVMMATEEGGGESDYDEFGIAVS